jgi:isoquinoline 1-oxidoreductase subunit beta
MAMTYMPQLSRRSFVASVAALATDYRSASTCRPASGLPNPAILQSQVESCIVCGLTAALYGVITIENGRVQQNNFDDYEMLRMADMPTVETMLVPSGGFWGGGREASVPPLARALCNAIFAAAGKRIRSLPLKDQDLSRV